MTSRTPRHDQPAPTRMLAGAGCITVSFRPAIPRRVAPQQSPLPLRRHGHSISLFTPGIANMLANLRLSFGTFYSPVHPRHSEHAGQPVPNFRVSPQGCTPGNLTGNFSIFGLFPRFWLVIDAQNQWLAAKCPGPPGLTSADSLSRRLSSVSPHYSWADH